MIKLWLITMILTSAHWKATAIPLVWQTAYGFDAAPCESAYACYYDNAINIDLVVAWPEVRHATFHEMQHRMVHVYGVWPANNDWSGFMELVADLVARGQLNDEQLAIIASWIGCADCQFNELHAELPWILDGNVPEQFADWYPWLELAP